MVSMKTFVILAFFMAGLTLQSYASDAAACFAVATPSGAACNALNTNDTACCYKNANDTALLSQYCIPVYNNKENFTSLNSTSPAGVYYTCSSSVASFSAVLAMIFAFLF